MYPGMGGGGGRPQDFERVSRTVHVGGIGGLGETITESDVADFFGQQGEVTAVRISGRFCWVEFADVRATHAALELDGTVTGGHHLRVSQSKSAIHSNGLKPKRDGMDAPGAPGGYGGYPGAPPMAHGGMPVHGHGSYGMPGAPAPYAQQYGYPPQPAYPQFPPQYGAPPSYGAPGAPPPQYPPQYPPHGYGYPPQPSGYPPAPQHGGYGAPAPGGYAQPPPQQGGYAQPPPPPGPPR